MCADTKVCNRGIDITSPVVFNSTFGTINQLEVLPLPPEWDESYFIAGYPWAFFSGCSINSLLSVNTAWGRKPRGTPLQKGQEGCQTFLEVKKSCGTSSGVFSLKRYTAGAFVAPFRILSRKNITGD